jgi:ABC-type uncharacterized transport system permease subunit
VIQPIIVQMIWVMLLAVLAQVVWKRAQRKLVIQGG